MSSYEYLKPVLGEELYTSFLEKMSDSNLSLINASDGTYVPKAKFDTEIAAKRHYMEQMETLSRDKAAVDEENLKLRDQVSKLTEAGEKREKEVGKSHETISKLQEQVKVLSGDLEQRENDLKSMDTYKGEVERLQSVIAERDHTIEKIHKQGRLTGLLREAGARNPDVLMRMLDLDRITETDGKVEGLTEQIKALKSSDPYLFSDRPAPRGGVDIGNTGAPLSGEDALNRQVNLEIRRAAGYNI